MNDDTTGEGTLADYELTSTLVCGTRNVASVPSLMVSPTIKQMTASFSMAIVLYKNSRAAEAEFDDLPSPPWVKWEIEIGYLSTCEPFQRLPPLPHQRVFQTIITSCFYLLPIACSERWGG